MDFQKYKEVEENYDMIPLVWDSNYFGIPSSRLNIRENLKEEDKKNILMFFEKFKFNTISNIGNKQSINFWLGSKTNAFLVDINIQFSKKITFIKNEVFENICIKENLDYNKEIVEIARNSFKYSRFFNDPYLPIEKRYGIYVQWVKSAFKNKEKKFVYLKIENIIVGFLIFSINSQKKEATIELLAVDNKFKGKRIGTLLINKLEQYLQDNNYSFFYVGTQANNIEAINFYTKYGFKHKDITSIYHLWTNN